MYGSLSFWLSYLLWNKGIAAIGATRGEIYSHLIPLSGGLFSVMFLHVTLHSYHLVSTVLILFGIALCSRASQRKVAKSERATKSTDMKKAHVINNVGLNGGTDGTRTRDPCVTGGYSNRLNYRSTVPAWGTRRILRCASDLVNAFLTF